MKHNIQAAAIWAKPWCELPESGGVVEISGGCITDIRATSPSGDLLLVPGLVNAHDHGRGVRPLAVGAADAPLESWLWDLYRTPSTDPYLTSLVAFGQMALSGITTVVHNHLPMEQHLEDEAKSVVQAAQDIGLRIAFTVPVFNCNLAGYDNGAAVKANLSSEVWCAVERALHRPPLAEQIEYLKIVSDAIEAPGVVTQLGPVGPQWISQAGWEAIGEVAQSGCRIHVHLLETHRQREWLDNNFAEGAASFFKKFGMLNERLTIAHGVFLKPDELVEFADAGATLVLNTSSNLRLSSGIIDGVRLARSGIRLGLGLDGMALDDDSDLLRETRLTAVLLGQQSNSLSRKAVLRAVFSDGRVAYDGKAARGIESGAEADIVSLSLSVIAPDRADDDRATISSLAFGRWNKSAVRDVWVDGRCVVRDGSLVNVDLKYAEKELYSRMRTLRPAPTWIAKARHAFEQSQVS